MLVMAFSLVRNQASDRLIMGKRGVPRKGEAKGWRRVFEYIINLQSALDAIANTFPHSSIVRRIS
jgi:hypothetical protein